MVPENDTPLTQSLDALVAAIEGAERRKDSRISRDVQVAIPHELSGPDRVHVTKTFASRLAERYHTVASWTIHEPQSSDDGDCRNVHAHVVIPTRRLDDQGAFGAKLVELDHPKQSQQEILAIRQLWQQTANEVLIKRKIVARVDVGRRDDGDPAPTLGPDRTALERKARRVRGRARGDAKADSCTHGVAIAELVRDGGAVTGTGHRLAQHGSRRRRRRRRRLERTAALELVGPVLEERRIMPTPAPVATALAVPDTSLERHVATAEQLRAPAPLPFISAQLERRQATPEPIPSPAPLLFPSAQLEHRQATPEPVPPPASLPAIETPLEHHLATPGRVFPPTPLPTLGSPWLEHRQVRPARMPTPVRFDQRLRDRLHRLQERLAVLAATEAGQPHRHHGPDPIDAAETNPNLPEVAGGRPTDRPSSLERLPEALDFLVEPDQQTGVDNTLGDEEHDIAAKLAHRFDQEIAAELQTSYHVGEGATRPLPDRQRTEVRPGSQQRPQATSRHSPPTADLVVSDLSSEELDIVAKLAQQFDQEIAAELQTSFHVGEGATRPLPDRQRTEVRPGSQQRPQATSRYSPPTADLVVSDLSSEELDIVAKLAQQFDQEIAAELQTSFHVGEGATRSLPDRQRTEVRPGFDDSSVSASSMSALGQTLVSTAARTSPESAKAPLAAVVDDTLGDEARPGSQQRPQATSRRSPPTADLVVSDPSPEDRARLQADYGADAIQLVEEFRRLQAEHGDLSPRIDLDGSPRSVVGIAFVDARGTPYYSARKSLAVIAAMEALIRKRPPNEIREIERTLEREIKEFLRTRERPR